MHLPGTVLVTGASSGIGRAVAIGLARRSTTVIACGRRVDALASLAAQASEGRIVPRRCELEPGDGIAAWMDAVLAEFPGIAGLVHCAGVHRLRPLWAESVAEYRGTIETNIVGSIEMARLMSRHLAGCGGGPIVMAGSIVGALGQPGAAVYAASKAAISSMVRSLAGEVARFRVRVNEVVPGMVETPLGERLVAALPGGAAARLRDRHPLGFCDPDDVANAVLFLLADESRRITGASLTIDSGYSLNLP